MHIRNPRLRRLAHSASLYTMAAATVAGASSLAVGGLYLGWDVAQTAIHALAEPWKANMLANPLSYAPAALGVGLGACFTAAVASRFVRPLAYRFNRASTTARDVAYAAVDAARTAGEWTTIAAGSLTCIEIALSSGAVAAQFGHAGMGNTGIALGYVAGIGAGLAASFTALVATGSVIDAIDVGDDRVYLGRPQSGLRL